MYMPILCFRKQESAQKSAKEGGQEQRQQGMKILPLPLYLAPTTTPHHDSPHPLVSSIKQVLLPQSVCCTLTQLYMYILYIACTYKCHYTCTVQCTYIFSACTCSSTCACTCTSDCLCTGFGAAEDRIGEQHSQVQC